ncbi:MAG: ATP-binding protein [Deltaproteobacteria bacterium]|jgi:nitrogen fixation/metabolism regulation signal transduction histidine kinase|nr:ATP-binding protein [Deltaproteobacteria bacterium]
MKTTLARRVSIAILAATLIPSAVVTFLLFQILSTHDNLVQGHLQNISANQDEIIESYKNLIVEKKKRFKYQARFLLKNLLDSKQNKSSEQIIKLANIFFEDNPEICLLTITRLKPVSIINNEIDYLFNPPFFEKKRKTLHEKNYKFLSEIRQNEFFQAKVTFATNINMIDAYNKLAKTYSENKQMLSIYKGLRKYYWHFFFAILVIIILAANFLAAMIVKGVIRKIGIISSATTKIARGDLDVNVKIEGKDEISELGNLFNDMVKRLKHNRNKIRYLERVGAWQEVARRIAHEIKNPLTPILLAIQQIQNKAPAHDKNFIRLVNTASGIIKEEVDVLKRLVENFGNLARLPEQKTETIKISTLITEIIDFSKLSWGKKAFKSKIETSEKIVINVDRMLMKKALLNVINNAVQATTENDIAPSIVISTQLGRNEVMIKIQDNGPGIEEIDKIFDPYYTTRENGTGLGLPLAKKIILDSGGDITVTSTTKGAEITITLPLSK